MLHPVPTRCWHHPHLNAAIRRLVHHFATAAAAAKGSGSLGPSAYETAWVALVRDPHHPDQLAFPEAMTWLLSHQQADGQWGAAFPYSVLPTMAALLAVLRAPQTLKSMVAAQRARDYLQRVTPAWTLASCDTPYIEFLLPRLYAELAQAGCELPLPEMPTMQERSARKLALVPLDALYSGTSPLMHALEAFGPSLDFQLLQAQQAPDGGYGYSPSATASVLLYAPTWDEAAAQWLRQLMRQMHSNHAGAVPTSAPSDVFEIAWSLFLLLDGGIAIGQLSSQSLALLQEFLTRQLGPTGAHFGRWSTLPPDVDDTAMVIATLQRLGQSPSRDALKHFQVADHYVTFAHERTSSPSANAHVLEALRGSSSYVDEQALVSQYLLDQQEANGSWQDKWSISAYYATMCCTLALARTDAPHVRPALQRSLQWIVASQQETGGWGHTVTSLEETAYSVLILKHLTPLALPWQQTSLREALRRGQAYLWRHLATIKHGPALWIDKDLYRPLHVIQAALYAALYQ